MHDTGSATRSGYSVGRGAPPRGVVARDRGAGSGGALGSTTTSALGDQTAVSENQPPRSPRPCGPRRPAPHRARAGGSARPVPSSGQAGGQGARGGVRIPSSGGPTPQSQRSPRPQTPTRAYPAIDGPDGDVLAASGGPGGAPGSRRRPRVPRAVRLSITLIALLLVILLGWGAALTVWSSSRIEHVDALSGAEGTPGTTYLIAGSDARGGEAVSDDGTEGQRTDTIMLLHRARNGNSYLVSLPRDTLVDIPGHGRYKLNAAFAFGGSPLLVETVEDLTGLTIDHYVEVGFDGVSEVVDAVGHVNLCIDQDVDDEKSGLSMTEGCHDVGGDQALAFVRARYFDPTADMGRQQRQQQFVGALMDRLTTPTVALNPLTQVKVAGSASDALVTSEGTGVPALGRMALTARRAMNSGGTLTMPIEDPEYRTRHSGIAIQVDDEDVLDFFAAIGDGSAEMAGE